MRIAIDISPTKTGHKLRGIGSYTDQLMKALKRYESKHSYYFFTRGQKIPKNSDLVHYSYFDPFFLTLPFFRTKPTVVTVHDLIPIADPEHFPKGLRGEIKWQVQKMTLKSVQAIITDSISSQKDIQRFTGFPLERIFVIYLAPSSTFRPITDESELIKVTNRFSLPKRFVLYVGDVNWNKNIPGLLLAFSLVHKSFRDIKLVLVGKQFLNKDLEETRNINKLIDTLDLKSQVFRPGFVEAQDLAAVYSLASVYVQPSFSEGFGFPVLEAMACSCPVVSANTSSLLEIAGPSVLVDPTKSEDMATGITKVLRKSSSELTKLLRQGDTWVKQFSWRRVAKETAAVYEKVLE